MEVAETTAGTGISKSSTAMSESSHEVSVEKTAAGSIEQESSLKRSVEQTVEKSVQQKSSQVVQKSVQSSVSDEKEKHSENEAITKTTSQPKEPLGKLAENCESVDKTVKTLPDNSQSPEIAEKNPKKAVDDMNDIEEENEEEIIEVEDIDDSGDVTVEQTIVLKNESIPPKSEESMPKKEPLEEDEPDVLEEDEPDVSVEVTIKAPAPASSIEIPKTEVNTSIEIPRSEVKTTPAKAQNDEEQLTKEVVEKEIQDQNEAIDAKSIIESKLPISQESLSTSQPIIDPSPTLSQQNQSIIDETTHTVQTNSTTQFTQKFESPQLISDVKNSSEFSQQGQSNELSTRSSNRLDSLEIPSEIKQDNIKNTLKEIISDIDRVIEQEEVQQQHQNYQQLQPYQIISKTTDKNNEVSAYTTKSEVIERSEIQDSTVLDQKSVDLQKIFTPAVDSDEILRQKNRKLYASSAFYSPTLHPTVEDQVELARRISHSLSDISNQQSKGQSMYVNRKKRSVKWVHEGDGKADIQQYNGYSEETKENGYRSMSSATSVHHDKVPLKLLMNPRGQIQDLSSVPHQGFSTDSGLLSPDKCAELVTALNAPKGKGAELFAKRRKKSEKWIVDETNAATHSQSGSTYARPIPTSPIVPAYSDLGVQRVQLNMHQDMVQDKYAQPRLKLIKTPWEAALETGSASAAFEDVHHYHQHHQQQQTKPVQITSSYEFYQTDDSHQQYEVPVQKFPLSKQLQPTTANSQRDLAYKPSIPQGWNAPPPDLPRGLYTPPEIPLDSYMPPPQNKPYTISQEKSYESSYQSFPITYPTAPIEKISSQSTNFPITTKPLYQPAQQYTKQMQTNYLNNTTYNKIQNSSPTPFNPSPLSYDKLAKFEKISEENQSEYNQTIVPIRKPLALPINKVRNISPTPFGASPTTVTIPKTNFPVRFDYQAPQMPAPATFYQQQQSQQHQQHQQQQQQQQHYYAQAPVANDFGGIKSNQQPFYPPPEDNFYNSNEKSTIVRTPSVNLSKCQNYNTAPRGWNQMKDYYRPITFAKAKSELPYTDF